MATIKDIAQQAGVSIGTVDRVLHNRGMVHPETKERILQIMKVLDYHPNHAAQALALRKKKLKICFLIPNSDTHPFYLDIKNAALRKADELKQYGVQVVFKELHETQPEHPSIFSDFKFLEDFDGLILPGIPILKGTSLFQYLEEHKIPFVFYNGYTKETSYLAYVGCNYTDAGRLAAGLSALIGKENAQICIYSEGVNGLPSHTERIEGFRQEISSHYPNMNILDIRSISHNQIDNFLSAQDMFSSFPEVNIVYVVNPADYGICEAIYRADTTHQVRIITNDLVACQIPMIHNGIISATICQEPEKQGSKSLDLLFHYLAYGTIPKKKMHYTNLSIHIAQNI